MKKTELKRGKGLSRKPLGGGKTGLRKTRLKARGKRKEREADAERAFRKRVLEGSKGYCAICGAFEGGGRDRPGVRYTHHLEAHHMVPRGRSGGDPRIHNWRAGAALCRKCHDETHRGLHPDFIKSIKFLDTLESA